jgi:hypothetical protein
MGDNLGNRAMPVPAWIFEQLAELMVGQTFPDHRHGRRGKPPTACSGRHVKTGQVVILMTGAAGNAIDAMTVWPATDIHSVGMAIVTLPGIVTAGMAIHAARMPECRDDRFEGPSGSV